MNEEFSNINWYPGHMTKTRRMMEADLKLVDAVCEIIDARIPISSRNPDIDAICGTKPRMVILNRIDMADPVRTRAWADRFKARGFSVIQTDCKNRKGITDFSPALNRLLAEKRRRYAEKGMAGKPLKAMVVGIPNVGKSTFINQVAGRKGAKAENRPGVTRGKQWVTVDQGLLLLDTPGILWPKFEDPEVGLRLAWTGAIKDDILDLETLSSRLMAQLWQDYPQAIRERYKLEPEDEAAALDGMCSDSPTARGYALMEQAARKRGFLLSGGVLDTERMAKVLLEEYRSCKLGRFTLEPVEG
ncbi:MAG: ribosome biogenesis GTPase YlqF [Oscillospiraceae bacterium]|nr:ribosome biogenesis GTPase YlqF [Oscillospiraceae bacterium]